MSPVLESAIRQEEVPVPVIRRRRLRPMGIVGPGREELSPPLEAPARVEARRRLLNVAVALLLLVTLLPVMLLIALAIRLTSRGPVIYTQTRVGVDRRKPGRDESGRRMVDYGGRLFTIYKFRTMAADPNSALQIWASPGDPRVTRVGRILRKLRLDELPQLVNVIRGDMNLVGPRPEQPNIFMMLRDELDGYQQRQRVLPGITGWAQVNQHYDRCFEDVRTKLRYDLEYIGRQSVLQDLSILLRTVPVIILQKGAW